MNHILAIQQVDDGTAPIAAVAGAIASIVDADVQTIERSPSMTPAERTDRIVSALAESDVVAGVLAHGAAGSPLCWQVAGRSSKPIVLVTRGAVPPGRPISRVLLPLDGTPESADAVAPTMNLLARAGVDLVVLHVFDEATVPKFWDHPTHAQRAWEDEFLTRHCPQRGVRLELRTGLPGQNILEVAASEHVDLIALGWSQRVDPGRARTVRRTVTDARVPVMLVPIATG